MVTDILTSKPDNQRNQAICYCPYCRCWFSVYKNNVSKKNLTQYFVCIHCQRGFYLVIKDLLEFFEEDYIPEVKEMSLDEKLLKALKGE